MSVVGRVLLASISLLAITCSEKKSVKVADSGAASQSNTESWTMPPPDQMSNNNVGFIEIIGTDDSTQSIKLRLRGGVVSDASWFFFECSSPLLGGNLQDAVCAGQPVKEYEFGYLQDLSLLALNMSPQTLVQNNQAAAIDSFVAPDQSVKLGSIDTGRKTVNGGVSVKFPALVGKNSGSALVRIRGQTVQSITSFKVVNYSGSPGQTGGTTGSSTTGSSTTGSSTTGSSTTGCVPVDGGWSDWSECSDECGGTKFRTCTAPPPICGGGCTGGQINGRVFTNPQNGVIVETSDCGMPVGPIMDVRPRACENPGNCRAGAVSDDSCQVTPPQKGATFEYNTGLCQVDQCGRTLSICHIEERCCSNSSESPGFLGCDYEPKKGVPCSRPDMCKAGKLDSFTPLDPGSALPGKMICTATVQTGLCVSVEGATRGSFSESCENEVKTLTTGEEIEGNKCGSCKPGESLGEQSCSVPNGSGSQTKKCNAQGTGFDLGDCQATSCADGFTLSGGSCAQASMRCAKIYQVSGKCPSGTSFYRCIGSICEYQLCRGEVTSVNDCKQCPPDQVCREPGTYYFQ